jgi:outer membrane PBP1 activator LpoA protein
MIKLLRHPACERYSLASILVLLASFLVISGCETPGGASFGGSGEKRAERMASDGDHAMAASAYMGLAVEAVGAERDRYTLLAVEQYLDAGDESRARSAFSAVARPQSRELLPLWTTNEAALQLYRGNADAALNLLEPLSRQPLQRRDRLRVEALRADAWIQKQDPMRAVELMMQRETWVTDRRGIRNNRSRLWQGLLVSRPQVLRSAAEQSLDPVVRGWLTIGSLAASTGQQGVGWNNGVVRWREENPDHPAILILSELDVPEHLLLEYPRQIALLLPLSGRNASLGRAIQNGFLGAYFATASGLDNRQSVRIWSPPQIQCYRAGQ